MDEEKEYYLFIKKEYELLAPLYDTLTIPFLSLRDKVANFVDKNNGSKLLDIATGTGGQAFALSKKGYEVIGIDLSKAMIKSVNFQGLTPIFCMRHVH
jgi:demethylmenaquinone methyltransferase/2-methoxy-6-polyprenyl-1,4-benzoquinol methylase